MRNGCVLAQVGFPNSIGIPLEKLLVRLADHGVQFIVVGGVAVALQGYLRTTENVDVLVEASR